MALNVEDGSGLAEADSYVSLADANAYWTARANAGWINATDALREASLRRAFDYLGYVYRWPGQPASVNQRGAWPRVGVPSGIGYFPAGAIPTQVIDAQLLLAMAGIDKDLLAKPDPRRVLVEQTQSVRGISKTQKFQVGGVDATSGLERIPLVDVILDGIVLPSSNGSIGTVKLIR